MKKDKKPDLGLQNFPVDKHPYHAFMMRSKRELVWGNNPGIDASLEISTRAMKAYLANKRPKGGSPDFSLYLGRSSSRPGTEQTSERPLPPSKLLLKRMRQQFQKPGVREVRFKNLFGFLKEGKEVCTDGQDRAKELERTVNLSLDRISQVLTH